MPYRTMFLIRATYENGAQVDSRFETTEDLQAIKEAFTVAETIAKLEGRVITVSEQHAVMDQFPESRALTGVLRTMTLRKRFNCDIHGPYLLITESSLGDDDLVAWWTTSDDVARREALV